MNQDISQNNLGKCLILVNPVAQSGKCRDKGILSHDILKKQYKQNVELKFTEYQGHAFEIAQNSQNFDSIIAVGGDGVVHEIAGGLMHMNKEKRPAFGVIPVGSGNDYARSLGMSFNVKKAISQLMCAKLMPVDVGKCNDQYFVETLSFGLDAGIAIDTMEARKKHNQKGFVLYFKCGLNRIKNYFNFYNFEIKTDDGQNIKGKSLIMAIQIGPTYGSGFKITPDAKLDDGYFNICYTNGDFGRAKALCVFAMAAKGFHVKRKNVKFAKAKNLHLSIDRVVPCQLDGEKYENKEFDIQTVPLAIKVYKFK